MEEEGADSLRCEPAVAASWFACGEGGRRLASNGTGKPVRSEEMAMSVLLKSLLLACAVGALSAPAFAQSDTAQKRPDLEGVWSNQSLTNLSRAPNMKLTVTEAEAKELVENNPWILLAASE